MVEGRNSKNPKKVDSLLDLLHLLGQANIFRAPVAPTSTELQEALGVTAPTLRNRLKLLQGLGFVEGVKAGRIDALVPHRGGNRPAGLARR